MITIQKMIERPFNPKYKMEFLIDSKEDVKLLPTCLKVGGTPELNFECAPGSFAYTANLTYACMLGNDGVWYDCM